jgi:hypothetical protein
MLLAVLAVCSEEELDESSTDEDEDEPGAIAGAPVPLAARREEIRNKILVVGKMQRLFQLLRCAFLFYHVLPLLSPLQIPAPLFPKPAPLSNPDLAC